MHHLFWLWKDKDSSLLFCCILLYACLPDVRFILNYMYIYIHMFCQFIFKIWIYIYTFLNTYWKKDIFFVAEYTYWNRGEKDQDKMIYHMDGPHKLAFINHHNLFAKWLCTRNMSWWWLSLPNSHMPLLCIPKKLLHSNICDNSN